MAWNGGERMTLPIGGPTSGFTFVASPFSHPNPSVRLSRYETSLRFAKHLVFDLGRPAFAPVPYGYLISVFFSIKTDASTWEPMNLSMLNAASKLAVLTMPGWEESEGVNNEIRFARDLGLPIEFWAPTDEPHGEHPFVLLEMNQ